MQLAIGNYTGSGSDGNGITGIGFQPDFVMVKDGAQGICYCSSSMGAGNSLLSNAATGFIATGIKSLDSGGFTLGTSASANSAATRYDYIALRNNNAGDFAVGSYAGNGVADTPITVGFQPNIVLVGSIQSVIFLRTSDMATNNSYRMDGAAGADANSIKTLTATGFTVGTSAAANSNGVTYYYIAIKSTTGLVNTNTFTGNGTSLSFTGMGFQPQTVTVKANAAVTGCIGFSGLLSTVYDWGNGGNSNARITSLDTDGYSVGSNAQANDSAVAMFGFGLKAGTSLPPSGSGKGGGGGRGGGRGGSGGGAGGSTTPPGQKDKSVFASARNRRVRGAY